MAVAYSGDNGATPLTVYTTPAEGEFALDSITFFLHCGGTAAEHHARVTYIDASGEIVGVLKDWNVAPDGATIRYTFGIGLISSACTVVDGETVEHDLTNTVLDSNTQIVLSSVDESGTDISGDSISACFLYATQLRVASQQTKQPIYFMPGSQVA